MKRWNKKLKEEAENIKIDIFLDGVLELCKKHKFSISHQDSHGAFVIEKYNKAYSEWLLHASDAT
jgi:hypothetical protein